MAAILIALVQSRTGGNFLNVYCHSCLSFQKELVHWLVGLPKPVGVLAWPSDQGIEVINACRVAGLQAPEQVAVIVGHEDPVLCEACSPPLSSICLATEEMGYAAAALLDRLMQGLPAPASPILIPPHGVVTRQSTDTLAMDNPQVVAAIAFIRANAHRPIHVEDVLRAVPVSRTQLELQFRKCLGRSPAAEIRRVHLERAEGLLRDTSMPLPDVADASGFGSPEYLAHAFKAAAGVSPLKFRNRAQGR